MLEEIAKYCATDTSREVCGVVIRDSSDDSFAVVPVPNVVVGAGAVAEFAMDPVVWFQLQSSHRAGFDSRYTLWARFHSHPRWKAHPSPYDISAASYPQHEIIYSPQFGEFCSYTTAGFWDHSSAPDGDTTTAAVGRNNQDTVVLTPLARNLANMKGLKVVTANSYGDWCRRYRELPLSDAGGDS